MMDARVSSILASLRHPVEFGGQAGDSGAEIYRIRLPSDSFKIYWF